MSRSKRAQNPTCGNWLSTFYNKNSTFLIEIRIEADVQELIEERRLRIVAKMDSEKYEDLKNKISSLEGVETFESKKKDKRFMTGNSSTNFLTYLS
jgi:hypothetical protein